MYFVLRLLFKKSFILRVFHLNQHDRELETKCKDLVFTFFVLSKQCALFGGYVAFIHEKP